MKQRFLVDVLYARMEAHRATVLRSIGRNHDDWLRAVGAYNECRALRLALLADEATATLTVPPKLTAEIRGIPE